MSISDESAMLQNMAQSWDSEISFSPQIGRQVVEGLGIKVCSFALVGEGWDNWAYLVNDEYIFRFPRRQIAVGLLQTETTVLPLLQPHLPTPVPAPLFIGQPTELYPAPFAGYRYLPGTTVDRAGLSEADLVPIAEQLGLFLRNLHAVSISEEVRKWAPVDTIRRSDPPYRLQQMKERIVALHDILGRDRCDLVIAAATELSTAAPLQNETNWVHGDLYSRHLLTENGLLSGVIDWGDVHLGDPALDLSIAFSLFEGPSRQAFFEQYGEVDEHTSNRARFRSLFYGIVLTHYGTEIGDNDIAAAGQKALSRATPS